MSLHLTFLGTNGWYATPLGNTVCALIETPSRYIVLDAGDGIHRLDKYATHPQKPVDLFLSHFHLDHTIGLHIQPKFHFKNEMRIFGIPGVKKALDTLVAKPFTAPYSLLEPRGLKVSIHELKEGKNEMGGYSVQCAPLEHADPCWGFRFEFENKILSYCTDTGPCDNLLSLSRNADIFITECSLKPEDELTPHWPHLNPQTAAQYAREAGVKKMFMTHFAAHKYLTVSCRRKAEHEARKIFPLSFAAMDEMKIEF